MKYSFIYGFGWLKINFGKKFFNNDVLICWDGRSQMRKRGPSKRYAYLYSHTPLAKEELEQYLHFLQGAERLIVGTGFEGRMVVMNEAIEFVMRNNIIIKSSLTPEAIALYNEELCKGVKVCALFHLTC